MSEVVRFIPKSEHERSRLIQQARVPHGGIFPPTAPSEQRDKTPASDAISGGNAYRSNEGLLS